MHLEKNEFTTSGLLIFLTKQFGKKTTGEDFNAMDVAQYCIRGYLPHKYGGNKLTVNHINGIKIVKMEEDIMIQKVKKLKEKKIKRNKRKRAA